MVTFASSCGGEVDMKSLRVVSSSLRGWQACSSSSMPASSSSSPAAFFRRFSSTADTTGDAKEKPSLKRTDMKLNVDISEDVYTTHSLATANSKEILNHKISHHVKDFQIHQMDTGSTAVQIAVLTEKIINLARHAATHKKDKHSGRGFQNLITRRRKLMQYMKRRDIEGFQKVVMKLGITREALQIQ